MYIKHVLISLYFRVFYLRIHVVFTFNTLYFILSLPDKAISVFVHMLDFVRTNRVLGVNPVLRILKYTNIILIY